MTYDWRGEWWLVWMFCVDGLGFCWGISGCEGPRACLIYLDAGVLWMVLKDRKQ